MSALTSSHSFLLLYFQRILQLSPLILKDDPKIMGYILAVSSLVAQAPFLHGCVCIQVVSNNAAHRLPALPIEQAVSITLRNLLGTALREHRHDLKQWHYAVDTKKENPDSFASFLGIHEDFHTIVYYVVQQKSVYYNFLYIYISSIVVHATS
jgi:hypothetical protein